MAKREHVNEAGLFQSDKCPECPPGWCPLSLSDPPAREALRFYLAIRGKKDAAFEDDLNFCINEAGGIPPDRLRVLQIIQPGEEVRLATGSNVIEGVVTQVLVEGSPPLVTYKVSWWDGRARVHEWLQDFEVVMYGETKMHTIGFAS